MGFGRVLVLLLISQGGLTIVIPYYEFLLHCLHFYLELLLLKLVLFLQEFYVLVELILHLPECFFHHFLHVLLIHAEESLNLGLLGVVC